MNFKLILVKFSVTRKKSTRQNITVFFLFLSLFFGSANAQTATAPSGAGTLADPHLITSLNNLYWVSQNASSWVSGKYFLQTTNIDAASTSGWNSGQGWSPIGNTTTAFSGNYNGGTYTISNLYINASSSTVGLFGSTNSSSVIKNLGVTSAGISSSYIVGAIVGENAGLIESCFATGNVSGTGTPWSVGGLVGTNTGTITKSYTKNELLLQ